MNKKLSELSKPVMYVVRTLDGSVASVKNYKYTAPKGFTSEPLYSQEYVSALLADNEYMRWRIKEMDLLFGKNLLAMRAAVIEAEHGEGHTAGMQWIFNTLFGPGEFAPENETDAQDYYNREAEKIDVEFSKCMDFFNSQRKAMQDKLATPVRLPNKNDDEFWFGSTFQVAKFDRAVERSILCAKIFLLIEIKRLNKSPSPALLPLSNPCLMATSHTN